MSLPNPSPDLNKVQAVRVVEQSTRTSVQAYAYQGHEFLKSLELKGRRNLGQMIAEDYATSLDPKIIVGEDQALSLKNYEPEKLKEMLNNHDFDPVNDKIEVRHRAYVIDPRLLPKDHDPEQIVDDLFHEVGMAELERFLPYSVFAKLRSKLVELIAQFTDFEVKVHHRPYEQPGGSEGA